MSNGPDSEGRPVEVVTPVPSIQERRAEGEGGWQDRLWDPVIGPELQTVVETVPNDSRERVRDEAWSVLSRCRPPQGAQANRTGLVVGYIQSGKTLSYTALSALAHDNGFRLVIVIAGTSTPLLHQTTDRLREDLSAEGWWGRWDIYRSDDPEIRSGDVAQVRASLQRWKDPAVEEEERRTVLITVMKDRHHLERVISLLEQLDLQDVPALVIDDEADQASLNIAGPNDDEDESATYRRILRIRSLLPHHSFLQYTATPQAVLLLNLIDQLSPDFGEVLTPGSDYTGGQTFFRDEDQGLIRRIPPSEIPDDPTSLPPVPPPTLLEALRQFFIGVSVGLINRGRIVKNRSMMIHPTYRVDPHAEFVRWVRHIRSQWTRILKLDEEEPDREELIEDFREAYEDLSSTVTDLPDFSSIERKLRLAIGETRILEVNAREGETPRIDWPNYYSWILVGGQALDRGFTVEGLTVSYVPRGLGVGNADTIQQRARWFGYKQDYLGFCRVYLPDTLIQAYRDYVEHEEFVRSQLQAHLEEGRSLKEWKRAFILSGAFKPTRSSVIRLNVTRGIYRNQWFNPRAPHRDTIVVSENRRVVDRFMDSVEWSDWSDDSRLRATHRHRCAVVSLERARDLLLDVEYVSPTDAARYNGVLVQMSAFLDDNPEAHCSVFWMRPTETTSRGTDDRGYQISELFQGAWPVADPEKIYPGDRAVRDEEDLTIQIHTLDVFKGPAERGDIICRNVPTLAVWVPEEMAQPWLVQV